MASEQIDRPTLNIPGETIYDDGMCAICMGPHENKSLPSCGHVFCYECLAEWCRIRQICPMCNRPITSFKHSFESDYHYQVHHCPRRTHRIIRMPQNDFNWRLIRLFLTLYLFVGVLFLISSFIFVALHFKNMAFLHGSFLPGFLMFMQFLGTSSLLKLLFFEDWPI